jgi:hypothetical protein
MERDAADIVDRFTIAWLKNERIGTEENQKEYDAFKHQIFLLTTRLPQYDWDQIVQFMYDVNNFIWVLESGLKSGKETLPVPIYLLDEKNKEGLSKVGLVSILLRNFNHLRVAFKNIINHLVHEGFQDEKRQHLSE